jgi:hypothetical protein
MEVSKNVDKGMNDKVLKLNCIKCKNILLTGGGGCCCSVVVNLTPLQPLKVGTVPGSYCTVLRSTTAD